MAQGQWSAANTPKDDLIKKVDQFFSMINPYITSTAKSTIYSMLTIYL